MASMCQCCDFPNEEDLDHIFLTGHQAVSLWTKLSRIFCIHPPHSFRQLWTCSFFPSKNKSFLQSVVQASAAFAIWELWMYRNKKKMEGLSRDYFSMIQQHLGEYSHMLKKSPDDSLSCQIICSTLHILSFLKLSLDVPGFPGILLDGVIH